MKNFKKPYLILLLLFAINIPTSSIYAQNLEFKIDSLLQNVFKDKNGPGGVFLVAKNGNTIYKKAFGKSNLELNSDLTTEDVFQMGSLTKQFTAIGILTLEEKGKLKLTDVVSKYIPDYPSGDKISIHHLLTHTSGIVDFTKMKSINEIAHKDLSPKEIVDLFKNEPLNFEPGEKFEYCNSGYVILGYIIELISGETYENYINNTIFIKAGMNHSYYASNSKIINRRAYGYHKKKDEYVNKRNVSLNIPFSSGSLMSTVDDMLKWQNALNKNLLVSSKTIKKAFSKYKLNNGQEFTYGYGWHILEEDGIPMRKHGGSVFGFKSMAVYLPNEDIYVVGFSNCDCNSPTKVTEEIALLTKKMLKD